MGVRIFLIFIWIFSNVFPHPENQTRHSVHLSVRFVHARKFAFQSAIECTYSHTNAANTHINASPESWKFDDKSPESMELCARKD